MTEVCRCQVTFWTRGNECLLVRSQTILRQLLKDVSVPMALRTVPSRWPNRADTARCFQLASGQVRFTLRVLASTIQRVTATSTGWRRSGVPL
jgi:hypothetical protein